MRGLCTEAYRLIKLKYTTLMLCAAIFFLYYLQVLLHINITAYYKGVTTPTPPFQKPSLNNRQASLTTNNNSTFLKIPSKMEFQMNWIKRKLDRIEKHSEKWNIMKLLSMSTPPVVPSHRVHIFYHTSYRNLETDGHWKQWNYENVSLPYMKYNLGNKYPTGTLNPPTNIASNYYPQLGCYSSRDYRVIRIHFKQIRDTGIGVVIVIWTQQEKNNPVDDTFIKLLNEARNNQLKIAFCIEVSSSSNYNMLLENIHYITNKFNTHPALFKLMKNERYLPVYYLHNSFSVPASDWRKLLAKEGNQSIRGTPYDGVFIALLIDMQHKHEISRSHFDGFYTYFSSNGLHYGSSWKNWKALKQFAEKNKLLFFPTVSPGYIDTRVRPWNTAPTRHRSHGHYYQVAWRSAISAKPSGVSITSYNNWQDGSQIEPAQMKVTPEFSYLDYQPEGSYFYLNLTRYWVSQFTLGES